MLPSSVTPDPVFGIFPDNLLELSYMTFCDCKFRQSCTVFKEQFRGVAIVTSSDFPDIEKDDIILCGSFYAIWPEIRYKFKKFICNAREKDALVIYDPNFRKSHLSELDTLKPLIIENMQTASLIKGSDEDFKNIFGVNHPDRAWEIVKNYCKCLVYTANVEGVYIRTNSFSGKFPVQKITPVSTIGAGDNFNAGMITSLYCNEITNDQIEKLSEPEWLKVITTAVAFATHVCLSYDNYISADFAKMTRKREDL